ncbi:hypothetical protein [Paenibacillus violae]|nr:hypothetical protein [Paenibacillus sp. PFR10]
MTKSINNVISIVSTSIIAELSGITASKTAASTAIQKPKHESR